MTIVIAAVADPGGPQRPRPPAPVKTSQKKDCHRHRPQVLSVIGPPSDKFLHPLLRWFYSRYFDMDANGPVLAQHQNAVNILGNLFQYGRVTSKSNTH